MSTIITESMVKEALQAAYEAGVDHIRQNGENPMGCGFAWVGASIRRNSRNGKILESMGFKKPMFGTGMQMWNPSGLNTQDMDAKYAGAKAFADVMKKYGFDFRATCRLD